MIIVIIISICKAPLPEDRKNTVAYNHLFRKTVKIILLHLGPFVSGEVQALGYPYLGCNIIMSNTSLIRSGQRSKWE